MIRILIVLFLSLIYTGQIHCSEINPIQILKKAKKNVELKNYDQALKDYLWFHQNALKYGEKYSAIRRTSALSQWVDLGKVYPLALDELLKIRETKTHAIKVDEGSESLFKDVQKINGYLGEKEKTIALFKFLINKNPSLAKECYLYIENDLVLFKEFKVCNKFIPHPNRRLYSMAQGISSSLDYYKRHPERKEVLEVGIEFYTHEIENIVLILTNNNRTREAQSFINKAKDKIDFVPLKQNIKEIEKNFFTN